MLMKTGILIPTWRDYTWIAPLAFRLFEENWPSHPEIWFCGLSEIEGEGLPLVPLPPEANRSNWTEILRSGVEGMTSKGFDAVYLIAEEHVPLSPCHEKHLNETLPLMARSLPAAYISLMGWDNRRYVSRSPRLGRSNHRLMHLSGASDPRFHLHPALWNLETLAACCDLALRDGEKKGSAWHFEKACAPLNAPLPEKWKQSCYQICASALSLTQRSALQTAAHNVDKWMFHRLMALYPILSRGAFGEKVMRRIPFDDVFCDGPYPMFFSGIMSKGKLNKYFVRFLARKNPALLERILDAMPVPRS